MATAWRSGSTSRGARRGGRRTGRAGRRALPFAAAGRTVAAAIALLALPLAASPARAEWKGNLALGYSKLFLQDAPSGGFAVALGVNQRAESRVRVGPVVAYHLLGTRAAERGSQNANIDYSLLEFELRADYAPQRLGPLRRISIGPSLTHAVADISQSSAGLMFEDLAVSEWKPGFGLDLALLPNGPRTVAVGVEAGAHWSFVESGTWTVGTLRLVLEY